MAVSWMPKNVLAGICGILSWLSSWSPTWGASQRRLALPVWWEDDVRCALHTCPASLPLIRTEREPQKSCWWAGVDPQTQALGRHPGLYGRARDIPVGGGVPIKKGQVPRPDNVFCPLLSIFAVFLPIFDLFCLIFAGFWSGHFVFFYKKNFCLPLTVFGHFWLLWRFLAASNYFLANCFHHFFATLLATFRNSLAALTILVSLGHFWPLLTFGCYWQKMAIATCIFDCIFVLTHFWLLFHFSIHLWATFGHF